MWEKFSDIIAACKLLKRRNRALIAWSAYVRNKCNRLYAVYKSARNAVVINIRKDKAQYQKSLVRKMKRSPKMFYSYVRSKQYAVTVTTVRNTAGRLSSNDTETSQILCDQFQLSLCQPGLCGLVQILF